MVCTATGILLVKVLVDKVLLTTYVQWNDGGCPHKSL